MFNINNSTSVYFPELWGFSLTNELIANADPVFELRRGDEQAVDESDQSRLVVHSRGTLEFWNDDLQAVTLPFQLLKVSSWQSAAATRGTIVRKTGQTQLWDNRIVIITLTKQSR